MSPGFHDLEDTLGPKGYHEWRLEPEHADVLGCHGPVEILSTRGFLWWRIHIIQWKNHLDELVTDAVYGHALTRHFVVTNICPECKNYTERTNGGTCISCLIAKEPNRFITPSIVAPPRVVATINNHNTEPPFISQIFNSHKEARDAYMAMIASGANPESLYIKPVVPKPTSPPELTNASQYMVVSREPLNS